ncbi:MAG TPA: hypothetical protein VGG39_32340 [Polyangiaceae bacterium]|jgi:hypothetical protein
MKANDVWTAALFACALAGGSVATWESGGARFEGRLALAAPRHPALGGRPETSDDLIAAAPEPPAASTPPAVARHVERVAHTAKAPAPPSIVIELPDVPEPVVGPPPTLDDLFPPLPRGSTAGRPCYDRLQGVKGISPCPGSTPREGLGLTPVP